MSPKESIPVRKVFVDVNYYSNKSLVPENFLPPGFANILEYLSHLPNHLEVHAVNRLQEPAFVEDKGVKYHFVKGKLGKQWNVPFRFHRFILQLKPDYLVIHGMGYVFKVVFLRLFGPSSMKILVQSNGYSKPPESNFKKWIFKICESFIDGFLFTGLDNAENWVNEKVIVPQKIFEVMEGPTCFNFDSRISKKEQSFLWVGRLEQNKDPLTILKAFKEYLKKHPNFSLDMVYGTNDLLPEVQTYLSKNPDLEKKVNLLGRVDHKHIEQLYREHQFFVLGSHYEGSGYSLMEAMACGCIPIVTTIAPYRYMTNEGGCALLFSPDSDRELLAQLYRTWEIDFESMQKLVLKQVQDVLSASAIAHNIYSAFISLEKK